MMLVSIEGVSRQDTAQPDGSVLAGGIQTNKVNSGYKRHLPTKDRQDTPRKLSWMQLWFRGVVIFCFPLRNTRKFPIQTMTVQFYMGFVMCKSSCMALGRHQGVTTWDLGAF